MISKQIMDFDLEQIAGSGQCFRMNCYDDINYRIIARDKYLKISQRGDWFDFYCSEEEFQGFWEHYFDLHTDYASYKACIDPKDDYMQKAASAGSGIRILHQDLWEMIVTFIISQRNNIPRIKKIVESLCKEFGEKKVSDNKELYDAFPTAQRISELTLEDLKPCSLGYRDRYLLDSAKAVASGEFDLDMFLNLNYEESKVMLMKLSGVGTKVAECISLFALHHIDAFPIDTHIQSILADHYENGFPFERYQGFAGILQQYAFYYDINKKLS